MRIPLLARPLLLGLGCLWLRTLRVHWPAGPALPERAVILLWHEHLPACIRAFSHRRIHVLVSRSADGAWAAAACRRFGYRVHRGSSTRGSLGGLRALARALESGSGAAGMALDGPRGPRRTPKTGSLWLARRSGLPVVPVWIEAAAGFRLNSWDRSLIPWPFARISVHIGAPFHPGSLEELAEGMAGVERKAGQAPGAPPPSARPG